MATYASKGLCPTGSVPPARRASRRSRTARADLSPGGQEVKEFHQRSCRGGLFCTVTSPHGGEKTHSREVATSKPHKSTSGQEEAGERLIAVNRRARHEYEVLETLECGIVLVGSEVKSLRSGRLSLDEAYARMHQGEVWLVGCEIPEYVQANRFNHNPRRWRKLLLHRREIRRFASKAYEKGLTLVPLKMYFKNGRAKVLLGVCRGRKLYDKRERLKQEDVRRDIARAMRRGR